MASTEIDLPVPLETNLNELADSTLSVFELLRPWCKTEYSSIKLQAQSYVKALEFSISAAQHGFNIAEEALTFADLINQGTEEERQEYLRGMLAIACLGEQNAKRAHDSFRDVRVTVGKLIRDAREQQFRDNFTTVVPSAANLNELENGVLALEKFSACISLYISWWSLMKMGHVSQTTRLGQVVIKYNSLRARDIVQKWRNLRQEYVDYTNKVRAIQDADPYFAIELIKARIEEDPRPPAVTEGSDDFPPSPVNQQRKIACPAVLDPTALFSMTVTALKNSPKDRKPLRKRDRFLSIGHRLWERN